MGCASCGSGSDGNPAGCGSKGGCLSGGCNRLNTYDWLAVQEVSDSYYMDIVEVSFKSGASKGFYRNPIHINAITGDMVVVDTGSGYNVGRISLSGELVRLQMRKKKTHEGSINNGIVRVANERDIERMQEGRSREMPALVRSRAIARTLGLEMKLGDVEYQSDLRKATFYYTADGRVDFRELVRAYAKEFGIKVEMRQIGARQESGRIGGLGSCGRELCCSTWLTDFKTVSTAAARYQNLSINQAKLSGQCGRLKCCLNYELDAYVDALQEFPKKADTLLITTGEARLIKMDIFKRLMFYSVPLEQGKTNIVAISVDRVKEVQEMNAEGEKPDSLIVMEELEAEIALDFADVTGEIELKEEKKRGRRRNKNRRKKRSGNSQRRSPENKSNEGGNNQGKQENKRENQGGDNQKKSGQNRNKRRNNRRKSSGNNNSNNNNNNSNKE